MRRINDRRMSGSIESCCAAFSNMSKSCIEKSPIDVGVICRLYLLHRQGAISTVLNLYSDELSEMNAAQREFVAGFIMNYPATTAAHTLSSTAKLQEDLRASIEQEPAPPTPAAVFAAVPVPPAPQPVPAPPAPIIAATGPQLVIPQVIEIESPKIDKSGLPWDERIHASTKGFTGDGLWRRKRGVSDSEYDGVTAQLRQLMNLPAPPANQLQEDMKTIGNAILLAEAGIAVPAVATGIPAPAAVDNRKAYIDLVGQCGKAIAAGKLTKEDVNNACASATGGVATTLPILASRSEFVPAVAQIITTLVESRG